MSTGVPTRLPSGMTNSYPKEILGLYGNPNPFQLHRWEDDFDWLGATGVKYTITAASGSVAKSIGDGGTILFTTGATATNQASIQLPSAGFIPLLGRRMWFAARLNIEDVLASQICIGLPQTTTTPADVVDGIVIEKAAASAVWYLRHYVGDVITAEVVLPAAGLTPVNGAAFDIGFSLNHKGFLYGYGCTVANGGLFGYFPQGPNTPDRGAICGVQVPALTAVALNPTLCILAGASGAELMTADFLMAGIERQ